MKRNIQDMTEAQRNNRVFLALATDEELCDFITRNALDDIVTFNCARVWIRGYEYGDALGADRCEVINTAKNKVRGNWYINRI